MTVDDATIVCQGCEKEFLERKKRHFFPEDSKEYCPKCAAEIGLID